MKRRLMVLMCLSMLLLFGCDIRVHSDDDIVDYCYCINQILAEEAFSTAKISDSTIILYDADGVLLSELPFVQYEESIEILSIQKEGDRILFVTQGAVDDNEGYLFINGDANKILAGLSYVERVGGNVYAFSTAKQ